MSGEGIGSKYTKVSSLFTQVPELREYVWTRRRNLDTLRIELFNSVLLPDPLLSIGMFGRKSRRPVAVSVADQTPHEPGVGAVYSAIAHGAIILSVLWEIPSKYIYHCRSTSLHSS